MPTKEATCPHCAREFYYIPPGPTVADKPVVCPREDCNREIPTLRAQAVRLGLDEAGATRSMCLFPVS